MRRVANDLAKLDDMKHALLEWLLLALISTTAAAQDLRIERVTFPTNIVPNGRAARPVTLVATLHLPSGRPPHPAVVITPSSGGGKANRETF